MPALEIRVIAYGLLALLIVGGCGWGGYTLAAHHYQRLEAVKQLAQDQALQDAQQKVIAAQAAQKTAEDRANVETLERQKSDTAARDAIAGSLRNTEAAVHAWALSSAMVHPAGQIGSATGTGSDPKLAAAITAVDAAVAGVSSATNGVVAACQHDSANYAYILSIAPQVTP